MTALIATADDEDKLLRPQWRPWPSPCPYFHSWTHKLRTVEDIIEEPGQYPVDEGIHQHHDGPVQWREVGSYCSVDCVPLETMGLLLGVHALDGGLRKGGRGTQALQLVKKTVITLTKINIMKNCGIGIIMWFFKWW